MMRTRLLWLSLGFASTSGAIAQFVVKDLWTDRSSLASQVQFHAQIQSLIISIDFFWSSIDLYTCLYKFLMILTVNVCSVNGKVLFIGYASVQSGICDFQQTYFNSGLLCFDLLSFCVNFCTGFLYCQRIWNCKCKTYWRNQLELKCRNK